MEKVTKKIEAYLQKQFPKKMILRASKKEINPDIEEIYGFMSICLSVYPYPNAIYYKISNRK